MDFTSNYSGIRSCNHCGFTKVTRSNESHEPLGPKGRLEKEPGLFVLNTNCVYNFYRLVSERLTSHGDTSCRTVKNHFDNFLIFLRASVISAKSLLGANSKNCL